MTLSRELVAKEAKPYTDDPRKRHMVGLCSIGLSINFHKSTLVPINVNEHLRQIIADIFSCGIGSVPFILVSSLEPHVERFRI